MKSAVSVAQVNPNEKEVSCDGGGGALGHPLVYLPFGKNNRVECYYCGKRFEKNLPKKQSDQKDVKGIPLPKFSE